MKCMIEKKLAAAGYVNISETVGDVMSALEAANEAAVEATREAWRDAVHADDCRAQDAVHSSPMALEADRIWRLREVLGDGTLNADLLAFGKTFDQPEAAQEIEGKIAKDSPVIAIDNGAARGIWCKGESVAADYRPYTRAERAMAA